MAIIVQESDNFAHKHSATMIAKRDVKQPSRSSIFHRRHELGGQAMHTHRRERKDALHQMHRHSSAHNRIHRGRRGGGRHIGHFKGSHRQPNDNAAKGKGYGKGIGKGKGKDKGKNAGFRREGGDHSHPGSHHSKHGGSKPKGMIDHNKEGDRDYGAGKGGNQSRHGNHDGKGVKEGKGEDHNGDKPHRGHKDDPARGDNGRNNHNKKGNKDGKGLNKDGKGPSRGDHKGGKDEPNGGSKGGKGSPGDDDKTGKDPSRGDRKGRKNDANDDHKGGKDTAGDSDKDGDDSNGDNKNGKDTSDDDDKDQSDDDNKDGKDQEGNDNKDGEGQEGEDSNGEEDQEGDGNKSGEDQEGDHGKNGEDHPKDDSKDSSGLTGKDRTDGKDSQNGGEGDKGTLHNNPKDGNAFGSYKPSESIAAKPVAAHPSPPPAKAIAGTPFFTGTGSSAYPNGPGSPLPGGNSDKAVANKPSDGGNSGAKIVAYTLVPLTIIAGMAYGVIAYRRRNTRRRNLRRRLLEDSEASSLARVNSEEDDTTVMSPVSYRPPAPFTSEVDVTTENLENPEIVVGDPSQHLISAPKRDETHAADYQDYSHVCQSQILGKKCTNHSISCFVALNHSNGGLNATAAHREPSSTSSAPLGTFDAVSPKLP
ncbi:hypothetical protein BGX26_011111 [Mortierella sp. AD094]|nr:hypothetical protein BGX26_011111 [Mortierella sp. AD094]